MLKSLSPNPVLSSGVAPSSTVAAVEPEPSPLSLAPPVVLVAPVAPIDPQVSQTSQIPQTLRSTPTPAEHSSSNIWHEWLPALHLSGMVQQLAEHCLVKAEQPHQLVLWLKADATGLQTSRTTEQLAAALSHYLGRPLQLVFESTDTLDDTPEQRRQRQAGEWQQQAEAAIAADPFVQALAERFGAQVLPGSVRPHPATGRKI